MRGSRATAEFHGTENMPPIRIVIADGEDNEDVVIKVSDEGGGIARSHIMRIWSYLFTTADPEIQRVSNHSLPQVYARRLWVLTSINRLNRVSWTSIIQLPILILLLRWLAWAMDFPYPAVIRATLVAI